MPQVSKTAGIGGTGVFPSIQLYRALSLYKSCNGVPKHENRRRTKRRTKRRGEKWWGSDVCAIAPVIRLAVHLHARILVIASIYKSTSTPGGHFFV